MSGIPSVMSAIFASDCVDNNISRFFPIFDSASVRGRPCIAINYSCRSFGINIP